MEHIKDILLIDDDDISNKLVKHIIRNSAERVHLVKNGKEALEFLVQHAKENEGKAPELIFIDISMPVMDGFEFLQGIKTLTFSNKPVKIILTSSTNLEDIRKGRKLGADDYIIKPFSKAKFDEILKNKKIYE